MPDWQPALAPSTQSVTSFTLVDSQTDQDIRTLTNNDTIDLSVDGTNLNIRANTNPPTVGSVRFIRTNPNGSTTTRTESVLPYAMNGDNNGDYFTWTPALGNFTLTATPYDQSGGNGTAGTPLTINFDVVDGG